jgi:phage terminase small subunit
MTKEKDVDLSNCKTFQDLPGQYQLFVLAYLKDFNGTHAAKKAGFKGGAHVTATRLLKTAKVQTAMREVAALILYKPEIASIQEVAEFLTAVTRSNITDVCTFDENGFGFNKKSTEMPKEVSRLIKKIKCKSHSWTEDGLTETETTTDVELHDPIKAAELLGRYHGMFVDKKEVSGPDGGPVILKVVYDGKAETLDAD